MINRNHPKLIYCVRPHQTACFVYVQPAESRTCIRRPTHKYTDLIAKYILLNRAVVVTCNMSAEGKTVFEASVTGTFPSKNNGTVLEVCHFFAFACLNTVSSRNPGLTC